MKKSELIKILTDLPGGDLDCKIFSYELCAFTPDFTITKCTRYSKKDMLHHINNLTPAPYIKIEESY
jgi:hypothetical protein